MTASATLQRLALPAAPIGPVNPLPAVAETDLGAYQPDGTLPADVEANMRFGRVGNVYPYLRQDHYSRDRSPRDLRVAVLENPHLRATFALDLGGRLLTLEHKTTGRDLLFRNPVVQPANLALRNAWISGGAEWNMGVRGHSPHTSSAVYAGVVQTEDWGDVLRIWEYERIRRVTYQLDFALHDSYPLLVWRARVRNTSQTETAMYWWTNMAVPESSHVFAPAMTGIRTAYDGGLTRVDLASGDFIRPSDSPRAADLFYESDPERSRHWIVAVDDRGTGIAHVSSAPLRGRKLFVWGTSPAGKNWNKWLNTELGGRYAEIQAGLTTTQYEHIPMPPRADWAWTEAIGPVDVGSNVIDSAWGDAVREVQRGVDAHVPADGVEQLSRDLLRIEDSVPRVIHRASGWYAADALIDQLRPPAPATPFQQDSQDETRFWIDLARGLHRTPDASIPPSSYVAGDDWLAVLEQAPSDWSTRYHRAVIYHARSDLERARELYCSSIDAEENAWSYRGIAHLSALSDNEVSRRRALRNAWRALDLAPTLTELIEDLTGLILDLDMAEDAGRMLDLIPPDRRTGRHHLLEARIALDRGDLARARTLLLMPIVVSDLREGERSLSSLWKAAFDEAPLPECYNFDM